MEKNNITPNKDNDLKFVSYLNDPRLNPSAKDIEKNANKVHNESVNTEEKPKLEYFTE